jgi:hypothetical protein
MSTTFAPRLTFTKGGLLSGWLRVADASLAAWTQWYLDLAVRGVRSEEGARKIARRRHRAVVHQLVHHRTTKD